MTKKLLIKGEHTHEFVRKQDLLHAEHPVDIQDLKEHKPELAPRVTDMRFRLRLSLEISDWIWEQYPEKKNIEAAVQQFIKDKYNVAKSKADAVR